MLEPRKILKLISILLGLISISDVVLLGVYIASFCLELAFLSTFLAAAIAVIVMTITSTALILFGCVLTYRNHFVLGGICNIIAGTITVGIYLYFTIYLPILQRFEPLGYFLLLPAPLSGLISIITLRKE
ncbi:MAG TPA: hypothetical protein VJ249_07950 [Candidatus Bathyarchaeia archaeon]|nr:hypothetical protein [Candidatus Bathyarchaeia archaeon]